MHIAGNFFPEVFHFDSVTTLLDSQATTAKMLEELEKLVANSGPGDVLHFHYSGHGSQLKDNSVNKNEQDGLDEIICPIDLDWNNKVIRDNDLKRIFDKVPNGVNLTVVLDCCHSGGGLDHDNQYQPLGPGENRELDLDDYVGRYLPPPADIINESASQPVKPRSLTRDVNKTSLLISGCQSYQTSADARIGGVWQGVCTYF